MFWEGASVISGSSIIMFWLDKLYQIRLPWISRKDRAAHSKTNCELLVGNIVEEDGETVVILQAPVIISMTD